MLPGHGGETTLRASRHKLIRTDSIASKPQLLPVVEFIHSVIYSDGLLSGGSNHAGYQPSRMARFPSVAAPYSAAASTPALGPSSSVMRLEPPLPPPSPYVSIPTSVSHRASTPAYGSYSSSRSQSWPVQGKYLPVDYVDEISNVPDYGQDGLTSTSPPPGLGRSRPQRKPSNRDEFDGPQVQFLARPPSEIIARQEREMPHLPTNLLVSEQDRVLAAVNDRLSQCAFDFVAKYQFPIPITQDMRPVERPEDREWTEWVYLLKRLATKRRIPARVLYNGQIKQFVTILENSLEMRHAAKHQSRPLKDDRNILQLISAGIQVAKILKDAEAMDYLDRLVSKTPTQNTISLSLFSQPNDDGNISPTCTLSTSRIPLVSYGLRVAAEL
ncbi:hypothetical protein GGR51DRAFT_362488 [Nemania sp. FL0031]|nr:hypothetical protein GGR51DRAFT_362488 [Nemania sp. FL0031]